jgi:hypothetical protein
MTSRANLLSRPGTMYIVPEFHIGGDGVRPNRPSGLMTPTDLVMPEESSYGTLRQWCGR